MAVISPVLEEREARAVQLVFVHSYAYGAERTGQIWGHRGEDRELERLSEGYDNGTVKSNPTGGHTPAELERAFC